MNLRNFFTSVWHQRATPTQKKCATPNQKSTMSWLETYILPLYFLGHGDFIFVVSPLGFRARAGSQSRTKPKPYTFSSCGDPSVTHNNPPKLIILLMEEILLTSISLFTSLFFIPGGAGFLASTLGNLENHDFQKVLFLFLSLFRIDGSFSSFPHVSFLGCMFNRVCFKDQPGGAFT